MTDQEKAQWFDKALKFSLDRKIHLVMKSNINGVGKWAIIDTEKNLVLNSNMEWEPEPPIAKDRDEAFLIRTRFDFETAVAQYEQMKMFAE
ncbi:MAG: hypothetical protein HYZ10_02455 [Ignavibacteriales bacterium]|nr:hypothetical protein [Ignavibacteriales bacterium]